MEYRILGRPSTSELEHAVMQYLQVNAGWRPIGGITIEHTGFGPRYYQAIIKQEEGKYNELD
jgi:hypothetical protein